jgi:hypothetical protein
MSAAARCYAGALAVLLLGLAAAAAIYFTAADEPGGGIGYVLVDGQVHVLSPGQSKSYISQLERFGGKAAVLFDEMNRWFAGLWQGKALGVTIGWISVAVAAFLFFVARLLQPPPR